MIAFPANSQQVSLAKWMTSEADFSLTPMSQNISPSGTVRGVIIASPSRQDPDYYFHWIRDSALVMDTLLTLSPGASNQSPWLLQTFADYAAFSRELQLTTTLTGLGEPRFNVDGTAFNGPWARPQNDGPALRVLTVLHSIQRFHASTALLSTILQTDLRYILTNFQVPSFDLWEEVKGDHFYTRLVQMAALRAGLDHFDPGWNIPRQDLQTAITSLQNDLDLHWRSDKKYFSATLNRVEGAEAYKFTDLDTAVILGVLHANLDSDNFSVRDDRVLATASQLETVFLAIYNVNANTYSTPYPVAPAIGRYADDVYFGGNPWYITTSAFAELNYRLSLSLAKNKSYMITELNLPFLKKALALRSEANVIKLKTGVNLKGHPHLLKLLQQGLKARGDLFMARLRLHTPPEGAMAEQFERNDGHPVSARDLTWSYASFLSAFESRKALSK